jgi:hypothetical protein
MGVRCDSESSRRLECSLSMGHPCAVFVVLGIGFLGFGFGVLGVS